MIKSLAKIWANEIYKKKTSIWFKLITPFLLPLTFIYFLFFQIRWLLRRPVNLNVKTIVVGNLTLGGNNKTPMVSMLVQALIKRGRRVAVVLSGYGRISAPENLIVDRDTPVDLSGDEAKIHSKFCPVAVGKDRVKSSKLLIEANPDLEFLIFDDGFQSQQIKFDFTIIMIGRRGFGNGHLIPLGPLRQSTTAIKFADCLILNESINLKHKTKKPTFLSKLKAIEFTNDHSQIEISKAATFFHKNSILLLTAIADPHNFLEYLNSLGINGVNLNYLDHHFFTLNEIESFNRYDYLICTEKDAVKLKQYSLIRDKVYYLRVELEIFDLGLGDSISELIDLIESRS